MPWGCCSAHRVSVGRVPTAAPDLLFHGLPAISRSHSHTALAIHTSSAHLSAPSSPLLLPSLLRGPSPHGDLGAGAPGWPPRDLCLPAVDLAEGKACPCSPLSPSPPPSIARWSRAVRRAVGGRSPHTVASSWPRAALLTFQGLRAPAPPLGGVSHGALGPEGPAAQPHGTAGFATSPPTRPKAPLPGASTC